MSKTNLVLVHDGSLPTLTPDQLHDQNGEPRIAHAVIAERLGTRPQEVARLIERNRVELESYGEVCVTATQTSEKGGRPGKAYHLNEGQALVICALSRTPQAAAVRRQIIDVFMAYRRGRLAPAMPAPAGNPELAALTAEVAKLAVMMQALAAPTANPAQRAVEKPKVPKALPKPALPVRSTDPGDLLYGVKAIAAVLVMRPKQAEHRIAQGFIPTFKMGRTVCARRSELAAWLAANGEAPHA